MLWTCARIRTSCQLSAPLPFTMGCGRTCPSFLLSFSLPPSISPFSFSCSYHGATWHSGLQSSAGFSSTSMFSSSSDPIPHRTYPPIYLKTRSGSSINHSWSNCVCGGVQKSGVSTHPLVSLSSSISVVDGWGPDGAAHVSGHWTAPIRSQKCTGPFPKTHYRYVGDGRSPEKNHDSNSPFGVDCGAVPFRGKIDSSSEAVVQWNIPFQVPI